MATLPTYIFGDTVNAVLNTARSRVDDLIQTPAGSPSGSDPGQQFTEVGGGTLLAELNPDGSLVLRTQVIFNSAWRKFQKYLGNLGYRSLIETIIISNIPANTNPDVGVQSWLSWNGNFNGSTFASTPALPSEFVAPLKIRERVNGATTQFVPMITALDGLRNVPIRTTLNRQWEWRNSALFFIGATGPTDLQIRAIKRYPDFVGDVTQSPALPWYYQLVPIPDCLSALAWYVAYEVAAPRIGQDAAQAILNTAEDEAGEVFNGQARADQIIKAVNTSIPRPTPSPQQK